MKRSVEYYRTKYFLGELTFKDLLKFIRLEGEFSIGNNWLPIVFSRVSKRRRFAYLFMDQNGTDPDVWVSFDAKAKIKDDVIHLTVPHAAHPNGWTVKLRLDSPPTLFSEKTEEDGTRSISETVDRPSKQRV